MGGEEHTLTVVARHPWAYGPQVESRRLGLAENVRGMPLLLCHLAPAPRLQRARKSPAQRGRLAGLVGSLLGVSVRRVARGYRLPWFERPAVADLIHSSERARYSRPAQGLLQCDMRL